MKQRSFNLPLSGLCLIFLLLAGGLTKAGAPSITKAISDWKEALSNGMTATMKLPNLEPAAAFMAHSLALKKSSKESCGLGSCGCAVSLW
jgi:hypothetical protein